MENQIHTQYHDTKYLQLNDWLIDYSTFFLSLLTTLNNYPYLNRDEATEKLGFQNNLKDKNTNPILTCIINQENNLLIRNFKFIIELNFY